MHTKFAFLVILFALVLGSTTTSFVNAAENEISTTLHLQDIGSLPEVPEVPTINVQPNTTYTYTLYITNNILLGNDESRKVSIVMLKPRLPDPFVVGEPVVCPSNWPTGHLGDNSEGIGSVVCTAPDSDTAIPYGQTGAVSFTFTTPPYSGTTDLSLTASYIKHDGSMQTTAWSPAVHIVVADAAPTSKDQCKNNGWKTFFDPSFKNQGRCLSFVQSK